MLLPADADGAGAEDELEAAGGGLPYWALTKMGKNTAVNASENFMVVGLPRNCEDKGSIRWNGSICQKFLSF